MKISFPASGPTTTIIVPDPEFRDQGQLKIGTTFKRMIDGTIVPFQHLPPQEEISLVFNRLKYKKAREFVDFLLEGNNQTMLFESDTGTSGEFLDRGAITGTIITDPIALVTQNDVYKNLAIVIALQETTPLQPKHIGASQGNQTKDGSCSSFYLIAGQDVGGLLIDNHEYARFIGTDGVWTERRIFLGENSESLSGFTIDQEIYVATGWNGSNVLNKTYKYVPAFDADGVWFSTGDTNIARNNAIGFARNNFGYILGGETDSGNLISCIELFKPLVGGGTWEVESAQLCLGIKHNFSFVLEDVAYVGGGNTGLIDSNLRSFDGTTWVSLLSDPLLKRESAVGISERIENKAIVVGGRDDSPAIVSDVSIYDPVLNTITASTALTTEVTDHTGSGLGDGLFSTSGQKTGSIVINENNEYNVIDATWIARLVNLSPDRYNAIAPCSNLGGVPTPDEIILPPDEPIVEIPAHVVVCGGFFGSNSDPVKTTSTWDFGAITARADMPSGRAFHQMASIGSSAYVVDGTGVAFSANVTEGFFEFDINFTWINRFNNPSPTFNDSQPRDATSRALRFHGSCDNVGDSLYLMGGVKAFPSTFENYSNTIDRWNEPEGWKASLLSLGKKTIFGTQYSELKYSHSSAVLEGTIFYIGGVESVDGAIGAYTSLVKVYNVAENKLVNRTGIATTARQETLNINGKLYTFTRDFGVGFFKQTLEYDSILDTWVTVITAPSQSETVVDSASSNTSNADKGVFFGGIDFGFTKTNNIEVFDALTSAFSVDASNLPTVNNGLKASPVNDTSTPSATKKFFVSDGLTKLGTAGSTFIYNPVNTSFETFEGFDKPTEKAVAESIGGLSYIIGTDRNDLPVFGAYDYSVRAFDEVNKIWFLENGGWESIPFDGIRKGGVSGVRGVDIIMGAGEKRGDTTGNRTNSHLFKFDTSLKTHTKSGSSVGDRMRSREAAMGTVVGNDYYQLGGINYYGDDTSVPVDPLDNIFGEVSAFARSKHFKVDFTVFNAPISVILRSKLSSWGIYLNEGNFNYILNNDQQRWSVLQEVYKYNIVGDSYVAGQNQTLAYRKATGVYIDGAIFMATGQGRTTQTGVQADGSTNDDWGFISKIFKYTISTDSYRLNKSIVLREGFRTDGINRVSTAF